MIDLTFVFRFKGRRYDNQFLAKSFFALFIFMFYVECRPISLKSRIILYYESNKLTYLLTYLLNSKME